MRDTTPSPPQPVQNSPHNTRHKAQPVQNSPNNTHNQRKLAISRQQGELFPVPNTAPPSRENFLPQLHHSIPITGTPPPNRHKTHPATPPTTCSARGTSQHAGQNSPGTPLQPFPRKKTRPATAQSWPNREKTLPARPKTPKSSHFSRAGRTFSRFQHRTTEQGEFSPATTPLNTHHRDTTTPTGTKPTQQRRRQRAQPGARVSTRDKTLPARPSNRSRAKKLAQQQPNLGQTAKKLSQRAQKHQNLANFPEQGELFRVSQTNSPRRANFFAQIQHSTCNSGTPLARHTQQSTHTLVIERKPLVVHRLSFPLVVIHRLTRKA